MRNVIYKIAACSALVALVLSGCKESFLEEDPNGYISSDQIKENAVWNPNIMLGQALGTYSTTFAWQAVRRITTISDKNPLILPQI